MERLRLELPLVLEAIDNILVTPADLMRQTLFHKLAIVGFRRLPVLALTVQYLRPGFNRRTLNASGTTIRFFLS